MDTDDQPTCGKGLAEHSALPATLAKLVAAMAEILEFHRMALDATDEKTREEHNAYGQLTSAFRELAADLQTTATQMAGYRNLPMGRHDIEAMTDATAVDAFKTFLTLEQDLLALLEEAVQRDQKMLAEMDAARASRR